MLSAVMMVKTKEWPDVRPMISSDKNGSLLRDSILLDAPLRQSCAKEKYMSSADTMEKID